MPEIYKESYREKRRVKLFISTKATMLEEKINEWLEKAEKVEGRIVGRITPVMSYAGQYGYMFGCTIEYIDCIVGEDDNDEDSDPITNMVRDFSGLDPMLNY